MIQRSALRKRIRMKIHGGFMVIDHLDLSRMARNSYRSFSGRINFSVNNLCYRLSSHTTRFPDFNQSSCILSYPFNTQLPPVYQYHNSRNPLFYNTFCQLLLQARKFYRTSYSAKNVHLKPK